MNNFTNNIRFHVGESFYIKDPESSELGRKIVSVGIKLIDELGFEEFTFRKLGQEIGSTEASIYRYFESKNKFLIYLSSWYWAWMEYNLIISLTNIHSPEKRLERGIALLALEPKENEHLDCFNLAGLSRIVNTESSKSYLTKDVDQVNTEGAFVNYKQLVTRLCEIVKEINPKYKYPNMLLSTVIEGIHLQRFFAEHLPKLTNRQKDGQYIQKFFTDLILKAIKS
ncbi:MAG: TetR/AcrR family transcriptional regulator [Bacteroidia bacterium]|nr:TetR/AcrR family transcriptional regulator [Bacteroidia bacterium]